MDPRGPRIVAGRPRRTGAGAAAGHRDHRSCTGSRRGDAAPQRRPWSRPRPHRPRGHGGVPPGERHAGLLGRPLQRLHPPGRRRNADQRRRHRRRARHPVVSRGTGRGYANRATRSRGSAANAGDDRVPAAAADNAGAARPHRRAGHERSPARGEPALPAGPP